MTVSKNSGIQLFVDNTAEGPRIQQYSGHITNAQMVKLSAGTGRAFAVSPGRLLEAVLEEDNNEDVLHISWVHVYTTPYQENTSADPTDVPSTFLVANGNLAVWLQRTRPSLEQRGLASRSLMPYICLPEGIDRQEIT